MHSSTSSALDSGIWRRCGETAVRGSTRCVPFTNDGLYVFLVSSPKRADLVRDPRYALHTFGAEKTDDEFYVTGRARQITDAATRAVIAAAYHTEVPDDHDLFELSIDRALHAKYKGHGDWPPIYTRWRSRGSTGVSR